MSSRDMSVKDPQPYPARKALPPRAPLPAAFQTLAFWRDPHTYLQLCRRRYGARFTITPSGKPPMVFTCTPSDIRAIVRAPANVLHPGAGGAVIAPLVGRNAFMIAEEDRHLVGRRAVLPGFQRQLVGEHAAMVRDIAEREVAMWPLDVPLALHPRLRALTLRVILQTIFDRDDSVLRELHTKLLAMFAVTESLVLHEPRLRRLPRWHGAWQAFVAVRADVDGLVTRLIEDGAHTTAQRCGLLAMLFKSPHLQTSSREPRGLRETIMSLILAGHETTASQLAWAFQLLAHAPAATGYLLDDLDRDDERYLTAVVYEVLRHRPVFLFTIPRAVVQPFELEETTYRPPVHLVGCVHLMHHEPRLYEEPDAFSPERFLEIEPSPEIWMPWGGGRKRCPGHHLAMLEMRTVIRTVLSSLELRAATDRVETARWRSVIVTPGRGCRVILRKRGAGSHRPAAQG